MKSVRIAALMTCYNRREKTLATLRTLFEQDVPAGASVEVYLVDDGSTDGTADVVQAAHPDIAVLQGDGSLFWNGGMRLAFGEAIKADYDFYLWMNDDTLLIPGAIVTLLNTHRSLTGSGAPDPIVVGSTQDPTTGSLTYGGVVRTDRWRPLKFKRVETGAEPRQCEAMNGNCVLIPREVVEKVGNLDGAFTHGIGDYDYALRARKAGCSVWVAPGYIGTCPRNPVGGHWMDASLTLRERLRKVNQPKGLPPGEWKEYARRYAGPFWYVYWLSPYLRLFVNSLRKRAHPGA